MHVERAARRYEFGPRLQGPIPMRQRKQQICCSAWLPGRAASAPSAALNRHASWLCLWLAPGVLTARPVRRFGTGGPLLASSYDPYPLPSLAPKATHSFQVRSRSRLTHRLWFDGGHTHVHIWEVGWIQHCHIGVRRAHLHGRHPGMPADRLSYLTCRA